MQFFYTLIYWVAKITGLPYDWLFYTRKVYFENRTKQKKRVKGGALFVSNHHSSKDFISLYFMYFFKRIRPVVGEQVFHQNAITTLMLKASKAIKVSSNPLDVSYINECVRLLKKGKKIVIYPEAHYALTDELLPFNPSFVKIAYDADVPIVPLYTDGQYSIKKRNHVMVGVPLYVKDVVEDDSKENIIKVSEMVKERIQKMQITTKKRAKTPLFYGKLFLMDLARIWEHTHFSIFYRVKVHDLGVSHKFSKIEGNVVIASNHTSFKDPTIIMSTFWRRRVHMLIADVVYGNKKLRTWALNTLGGIKISRETNDLKALSRCVEVLNSGRALLVFPEGHINRDENVDAFKNGASMIAARTASPILPVYIKPRKHWYNRTHVYVGEMITAPKFNMNVINENGELIREAISSLEKEANSIVKK